jgi:uncharacterized membrane protein (DUF4010 family)
VLPDRTLDPWGLIEPKAAWVTVLLVASLGFVNYVLLKLYGTRGVGITAFLGGLVNSTVAVTELSGRVREGNAEVVAATHGGLMLAVAAMLVRNAVLLGILAPRALLVAGAPLAAMLSASGLLAAWCSFGGPRRGQRDSLSEASESAQVPETPTIRLSSPFSLRAALQFGLIFLAFEVSAALTQRFLGSGAYYGVSAVGGVVSSASAVASAGTLASQGRLTAGVAAHGAVIASLTSALVNLPLVARIGANRTLTRRFGWGLAFIAIVGILSLLLVDALVQ